MKKLLIFCLFPIYSWAQCGLQKFNYHDVLVGSTIQLASNNSYCSSCIVTLREDGKCDFYHWNIVNGSWYVENTNGWNHRWTIVGDKLQIEFRKVRERKGLIVFDKRELYSILLNTAQHNEKNFSAKIVLDKKTKEYKHIEGPFRFSGVPFESFELIKNEDYVVSDCVKLIVERKINNWQRKDQFEKTKDYLDRINEKNRLVKQKEFQQFAIDSLGQVYFQLFCDFSNITLEDYDADNETYLLKNSPIGDIVLKVPIAQARMFPNYFNRVSFQEPEFVINNDKFVLTQFKVVRPMHYSSGVEGVDYFTYKSDISEDYTITDIEYEYARVEIEDLNTNKIENLSQITTRRLTIENSSVNTNIPIRSKVPNRYALVIGNEDYSSFQRNLESEQNVDYASHDAEVFKKYCLNTLGVKEENMNFLINATAGSMNQKINKVLKLMEKLGPEGELVIYYAGHGFPDEQTKEPYLIPVDVSGTDLSYAVKLQDLYKKLGNTGAKTTVFLDACFTGSGRNSGLIAARGVRVKPKEEMLSGDVVVFSASSGEQSALPYHQEGHGLFTYYLLEKLQESEGDISYGDLADYINSKVSVTSINVNEKEQDPVVNTSEKVADSWRNWSF
ncbi:MAG: caspase family protein [Bacteroidota bacterium]|nr:caspase family protein [Bacteroidota bacterium]